MTSKAFRYLKGLGILAIFSLSLADAASAQTIRGILMENGTDRRIQLGEMVLVGQGGDTIDVTYTNDAGGFELTSPDPGDFLVLADALGYGAMAAGGGGRQERAAKGEVVSLRTSVSGCVGE